MHGLQTTIQFTGKLLEDKVTKTEKRINEINLKLARVEKSVINFTALLKVQTIFIINLLISKSDYTGITLVQTA